VSQEELNRAQVQPLLQPAASSLVPQVVPMEVNRTQGLFLDTTLFLVAGWFDVVCQWDERLPSSPELSLISALAGSEDKPIRSQEPTPFQFYADSAGLGQGFLATFAPPAGIANLSPTSLTFAGQPLTTTSPAQTVTLSNTGGAPLTITSITSDGDFSESNTCGGTLASGANCPISVAFAPTVTGGRNGTLTVYSDAPGSPHTVSLTGTGTDFSVSASPGTQTVKAGKATTYALSLGPLSGFTGVAALSCPGAPARVTCTFTPTSVQLDGTHTSTATASVKTTSGKKGTPRGTYTLTFTGTSGTLSHSATAILVVR